MTLRDEDERLHQPPGSSTDRWQENLFFICWDTAIGTGLVCHIRRAPASGVQEAQLALCLDGVTASAWLEAPYSADRLVPGVTAEPIEPFRRWALGIDCLGVEGTGPLGFLAAVPGGSVPLAVDVTLHSALPVADFAAGLAEVVRGMREHEGGPQMGDQQHYEQGGTWAGRLRIGDRHVDAQGLFVRDHSWGIRDEQQDFKAFWTASCLDGGRLFCNAIGVPSGDRVLGIGAVAEPSGVTFTTEVGAVFSPAPGVGTYDQTVVSYGSPIGRELTARTVTHVPLYLPHSGPRRYDNNAISTVHMGEATGFGVMEWAAVLDPSEASLLDAAERVP